MNPQPNCAPSRWVARCLSSLVAPRSLCKCAIVAGAVVSFKGVAESSQSGAPTKVSGPPDPQAWAHAATVTPTRISGARSAACQVRRIDSWLKVRCPELATSAITQLGGSSDNVFLQLDPTADDGLPRAGELVARMEPSDVRVFSFWSVGEGYDGPLTIIASVIVQAEAVPGQEPSVLLHDALNEPVRTAQSELRRRQPPQPQAAAEPTTEDHTAP